MEFVFVCSLLQVLYAVSNMPMFTASTSVGNGNILLTAINESPQIVCNGYSYCVTGCNRTLVMTSNSTKRGDNYWGGYTDIETQWTFAGQQIVATHKTVYDQHPLIEYTLVNTLLHCNTVVSKKPDQLTSYPTIELPSGKGLRFLHYGLAGGQFGPYRGFTDTLCARDCGETGGYPLVLYDSDGSTNIISPSLNFKELVLNRNKNNLLCGIRNQVSKIDQFFQYSVVVLSSGTSQRIRKTMLYWGDLMRKRYNKQIPSTDDSLSLSNIALWTDNGAYYYYNTVTKTGSGANYTKTFVDLHQEAKQKQINYASYQLDSFFYPKTAPGKNQKPSCEWTAINAGFDEWVGCKQEQFFPNGLSYLQKTILDGTPLACHSRWVSPNSVYTKDSRFQWSIGAKGACAIQAEAFFDHIIGNAKESWNLTLYEQDWIGNIFYTCPYLVENLGKYVPFLQGMSRAASKHGVSVGWGTIGSSVDILMALQVNPVHFIFGVPNPHTTSTRVQTWAWPSWSNIIAQAVGIYTMKDVFWTSVDEPGAPYKPTHWSNPSLQAITALLTNGPVGVGDKFGKLNATVLLPLLGDDRSTLLKPNVACTSVDKNFFMDWNPKDDSTGPVLCQTYATTQHDFELGANDLIWLYLLAADLQNTTELHPSDLDVSSNLTWIVHWSEASADWSYFSAEHPVKIPHNPVHPPPVSPNVAWQFYKFSPFIPNTNWVIRGDKSKHISAGRKTIQKILAATTNQLIFAITHGMSKHVTVGVMGQTYSEIDLSCAQAHVSCTAKPFRCSC